MVGPESLAEMTHGGSGPTKLVTDCLLRDEFCGARSNSFLDRADCHELSCALGWEGDAYTARFPRVDRLWLEAYWQEADLERRSGGRVDEFLRGLARGVLEWLTNPGSLTMDQFLTNAAPPPDPLSKKELVDRVSRKTWSDLLQSGSEDPQRDERWAIRISQRSACLRGGWIAVVVGWAHADPAGGSRRLCGLLSSSGFRVNSVCLAPD